MTLCGDDQPYGLRAGRFIMDGRVKPGNDAVLW
jgi:hypothetical protein